MFFISVLIGLLAHAQTNAAGFFSVKQDIKFSCSPVVIPQVGKSDAWSYSSIQMDRPHFGILVTFHKLGTPASSAIMVFDSQDQSEAAIAECSSLAETTFVAGGRWRTYGFERPRLNHGPLNSYTLEDRSGTWNHGESPNYDLRRGLPESLHIRWVSDYYRSRSSTSIAVFGVLEIARIIRNIHPYPVLISSISQPEFFKTVIQYIQTKN